MKKIAFIVLASRRERKQLYGLKCYMMYFSDRLRMFYPLFLIWTKMWHDLLQSHMNIVANLCSGMHKTCAPSSSAQLRRVELSWVWFCVSEMTAGKKVKWLQKTFSALLPSPLYYYLSFTVVQLLSGCTSTCFTYTKRETFIYADSNETFSIESLSLNFPLHV